jgi:di- and tripeptidase
MASAAGVFQDRRIYVTGGNDNSVAIWDPIEHPVGPQEIQPIGNGTGSSPLRWGGTLLTCHR